MAGRTVINEAGMRALMRSPEMRRILLDAARAPVRRMQALAPKRTGAGAASIHGEAELDRGEWTVRMSWDRTHRYMRHQEFGTKRGVEAKHFLERGLGVNLTKR